MTDIYDLVKRDLDERRELSMQRYGAPFVPHGPGGDGGPTLLEAYREQLDFLAYLRKELTERGILAS